ncbi:MAG: HAMP domain-containing sensor histidine kinase [Bdellovibrionota bacterium]
MCIDSLWQKLYPFKKSWQSFKIESYPLKALLILAFLIVTSPLLISSIYVAHSLGQLSKNNTSIVLEIAATTRSEQKLRNTLQGIERYIKQYKLFRDEKIRAILSNKIADLRIAITPLENTKRKSLSLQISKLIEKISYLEKDLNTATLTNKKIDAILNKYDKIYETIDKVTIELENFIDATTSHVKSSSKEFRNILLIGSLLIIPLTLILILFFIKLIGNSFKQLESAISQLGDRTIGTTIYVSGPKDIQNLGFKLNWLRIRLDKLENQKQKFLKQMSHELKTPIANFQEGVSLLEDQIPGSLNRNQMEIVNIMRMNVDQLKRHINNLLDYNRVDDNHKTFKEKFNLSHTVDEVLANHKLSAESKQIQFNLMGTSIEMQTDRQKFKTALDNLISNAVDFTKKQSNISICWHSFNKKMYLQVIDDGPGIPEIEKENIFIPFYQGTATRNGPLKGSGIGLYVASECIKSIGGVILARNHPARGACFEISAPISLELCQKAHSQSHLAKAYI